MSFKIYYERLAVYVKNWYHVCGFNVAHKIDGQWQRLTAIKDGLNYGAVLYTNTTYEFLDITLYVKDAGRSYCQPPRWLWLSCPQAIIRIEDQDHNDCWCGEQITELADWYGCAHCEDCKDKWQDRKNAAAL